MYGIWFIYFIFISYLNASRRLTFFISLNYIMYNLHNTRWRYRKCVVFRKFFSYPPSMIPLRYHAIRDRKFFNGVVCMIFSVCTFSENKTNRTLLKLVLGVITIVNRSKYLMNAIVRKHLSISLKYFRILFKYLWEVFRPDSDYFHSFFGIYDKTIHSIYLTIIYVDDFVFKFLYHFWFARM